MTKSLPYHKSAWNYYKRATWRSLMTALLAVLSSSSLIFVLLFSGIALQFLVNNNLQGFFTTLGINIAISLLYAAAGTLNDFYKFIFEQNVAFNIRKDLSNYLTSLRTSQYKAIHVGEVHNWLIKDTNEIAQIYVERLLSYAETLSGLILVLIFILVSPGSLIGLGTSSNYLLIFVFLGLIVFSILTSNLFKKVIEKKAKKLSLVNDEVNSTVLKVVDNLEYLSVNQKYFKGASLISHITQKWGKSKRTSLNWRSSSTFFTKIVSALFSALFLIVIILLLSQGRITSIAFLTAGPALLATVSEQSIELYNNILKRRIIKATLAKWTEVLPETVEQAEAPLSEFRSLELQNITSPFVKSSLLVPFNLTIKKGQKIAFVGANGSGKSMLLKILLGLENDFQGTVYFNDARLAKNTCADINDQLNFIETKSHIFMDSINANVALSFDAAQQQVHKAKEKALVDFNDQEDNDINKFSTGQKQRIALAQAYFFDKDFVIWDEALSNLDPGRVKILEEKMLQQQGLTFIHILHTQNSASLAKYDQVVHF